MSVNFTIDPVTDKIKRLFDLLLAVTGLLLTLPLLLLITIAIKLDSPGPVFFRQLRIGKAQPDYIELFEIIKFRTKMNDAERLTQPLTKEI